MTEPDLSWMGTPLPVNERIAERARDAALGSLKAMDKIEYLSGRLAAKKGAGSDDAGTFAVTVDHAGAVVGVVVEERKWARLDQDQAERAIAQAANRALAMLAEEREKTRSAFFEGFGLKGLPTFDELARDQLGPRSALDEATGRGADPEKLVTVVADHNERVKGVIFDRQRFGALGGERAGAAFAKAANAAITVARALKLAARRSELEQQGHTDLLDTAAVFEKIFPEQMERHRKQQQGGPA